MSSAVRSLTLMLFYIFVISPGGSQALIIDGCPLYGCRPSGSFSFYSSVPDTISLNWQSHTFSPVPNALGCSADSCSIICTDNGVFSNQKGYVSLYGDNGTVRWRDPVLLHPTLALVDNFGDVTGSDGKSLVHYDMDGKKYPIINVYSMAPIFSITLVGTTYLLMISEQGCLSLRDTNAIPDASIFLNATVQRTNGTFLPTAQPVVNGLRFYLLTEFVPEETNKEKTEILNMQRLYAIDVHDRMSNIMTIAWTYDFEMLQVEKEELSAEIPKKADKTEALDETVQSKQVLLWDNSSQTVFVNLPPPLASQQKGGAWTFWGLRDAVNDSTLLFRNGLSVTHMAKFEPDSDIDGANTDVPKQDTVESKLWVSTTDGRICNVNNDGKSMRTIYLPQLLKTEARITSKLAVVRYNDSSVDVLVFGIQIDNKTNDFMQLIKTINNDADTGTFVVAIDTTVTSGSVKWMFPVPDNLEVKGQITGSLGIDYKRKDQFLLYAENSKTARIISIH